MEARGGSNRSAKETVVYFQIVNLACVYACLTASVPASRYCLPKVHRLCSFLRSM